MFTHSANNERIETCGRMFAGFFMSLRQQDFRVRRCWETRLKFRLERMVWQKGSRGVSSRPMPFSERGSRCKRVWEQVRSRLGADSVVSGTMFADKYGICIVRLSNLFSALPILKVNSISIKHRRWGMTPSLLCSWDDRIKKDCLSTLDRQSFSVLYSHEA